MIGDLTIYNRVSGPWLIYQTCFIHYNIIVLEQSNYLAHLLACVDAILTVSESDCLIIRSHLFKIGISILALAPDQKLKEEARGESSSKLTFKERDLFLEAF